MGVYCSLDICLITEPEIVFLVDPAEGKKEKTLFFFFFFTNVI